MILYDSLIRSLPSLTGSAPGKSFAYDQRNCREETKDYQMLMQRDTAFELGGDGLPSLNMTCVTSDPSFFTQDGTELYGPDLGEIKKAVPYARITLLLVNDLSGGDGAEENSDTAFRAIEDMDFVKYRVYMKGFMVRTAGLSNREQVRVGKEAVKDGISFAQVGNTLIKHYKENLNVRCAKVLFITAPDADYKALSSLAQRSVEITKSLSQILQGMPKDCDICGIKDICSEVEGLRELHFGKQKNKTTAER